jgi:hypothetical protein
VDVRDIASYVERVRRAPEAVARLARQDEVRLARAGSYHIINPDAFSEDWPKATIANFLNTAAQDMAESLAPLPSLSCASGSMMSDAAKKKGADRGKIGQYYWQHSRLKKHAVTAADWFFTYSYLPILVEPDLDARCPRIRFEDPYMAFPEIDRFGKVTTYTKVLRISAQNLAAMFPEAATAILVGANGQKRGEEMLEVVRFSDKNMTCVYINDVDRRGKTLPVFLSQVDNPLSRIPVSLATRETLDGEWRGQYDDAIWVQIARAKLASLALEAGVKAVEAPIAVPQDLVELPIGADAIWRTDSPEKIRRIGLEVPQSAFAMDQRLEMEAMRSTRYPEARGGNIQASVITGRGVDALMGSFDMLIKTAQDQFGDGLREATSLAFEMDEKLWPSEEKSISGISAGAPYALKYRPEKAIGGDYSCEVTYGLAAGLAPNNAVVLMLQLLGAGLVSKESVQKQLPFDVDPLEMNQAITLEQGRAAILAGVQSYAQSIPAMAAQGMDPMQALTQISTFMKEVRNGKDIEAAALKAFTPPEPSPEELAAQEQAAAMAAGGGPGGGLVPGAVPGATPAGAEGVPQDIASMVASFRGGRAEMGAAVKRNAPLA